MALFCDFENVALGVRDVKLERFDIKPVLERLLLKGSIVVKKAYCDWDRYKAFKAAMHEASFELIEIPHVRQSGKNSADIRLVVDALDLCYTKSHVDTFVIISGDSDFSPLVSKLRENAKKVIGVGVKQSTSDLLVANCDEFIFYDDLVTEQRGAPKREADASSKRSPEDDRRRKQEMEERKSKAIAIAVETFEALASERGESGKIWASVLKSAIKRRKPGFNEAGYGFRAFGNLLEEAQARGFLEVGRDDKSGAFVYRSSSWTRPVKAADVAPATVAAVSGEAGQAAGAAAAMESASQTQGAQGTSRDGGDRKGRNKKRKGGNGRHGEQTGQAALAVDDASLPSDDAEVQHSLEAANDEAIQQIADESAQPVADAVTSDAADQHEQREPHEHGAAAKKAAKRSGSRRGGKSGKSHGERDAAARNESGEPEAPVAQQSLGLDERQPTEAPAEAAAAQQPEAGTAPRAAKKAARKTAAPRSRRPRKAVVESGEL